MVPVRERPDLFTNSSTRKLQNITRKARVYFSIDTDDMPNKGVKGKATASIVTDDDARVSLGERIVRKYVGDAQTDYARGLLQFVKGSRSTVVEIVPRYYTVWDYSKMM